MAEKKKPKKKRPKDKAKKGGEKAPPVTALVAVSSDSEGDPLPRPWKWTKKKRKAARLLLRGMEQAAIAAQLKVHRHTVRNWRKQPEFIEYMTQETREYVARRRHKRVYDTGTIADVVSSQLAKRLARANERFNEGHELSQTEVNMAQMLMREYREYRTLESSDFGDNTRRGELSININQGAGDTTSKGKVAGASFKKFFSDQMVKMPDALKQAVGTPQELVIQATREMLRSSDVMEKLYEEEKAEEEYEMDTST